MPSVVQNEFLQLVEQHEQVWGARKYRGRPTLSQIMKASVAAFWIAPGENPRTLISIITLHDSLDQIRNKLIDMVFYTQDNTPRYRLYRLFYQQQRVKIKEVRILFDILSK
jgi:hypothetical protein